MAIPVSASINQLNAEVFIQEGYELSLDAIVPSITLTGSFSQTTSKTQFYIYNYSKTILYENLNYNANGSYLTPESGNIISNSTSSYNQFELNPIEDIYNQGYSSGNYYALYNFIDYELGSEFNKVDNSEDYNGHPYFIKDISGDRTELRIQNNYLSTSQIESYYQQFTNKINARENADEFYVSFGNNRNFIGINSQLELPTSGSTLAASILIKLYKPLPLEFEVEQQLQIISKVGETQVFSVDFQPNLEFIDNLLQLKGPNYNIDVKDKINNSTNFKNLNDLVNTVSSQSYYQFNSLKDQKGIILRKNWGDWNEFVKYSSAEQRLKNFKDKLISIEDYEAELTSLGTIGGGTPGSSTYSSSYNNITNNINKIISKFDSYEYYLYYITGSEAWPKRTTTYPYVNYSVTSSEALNWFGSTNENSAYYNSGKNQIYSASRYDNNNQDYLYYLIPPFITENSSNDQYIKFVNMVGQTFDEMYIYTEGVEQVRNTNSGLTGSILPLGLADDVIESLGFDTYGNDFNSIGFNPNGIGVFPAAGSGLEYIDRYIDIASGSVINYYDQQQSTLGFVIALADPSFPYPIENSSQEIYKRIFHNMVSLVKRKGTVTGLRQLINIWGVPNTMLRISEFGGKNKNDENDYDLWMNRYSTAFNSYATPATASIPNIGPNGLPTQNANVSIPWQCLAANYRDSSTPGEFAVADCIQFRFKTARNATGTTNFSESVLFKRGDGRTGGSGVGQRNNGEFGIFLHQSGSNSGSYSGASMPHYNTYASMSFVISGSISEGASFSGTNAPPFNYGHVYITDPIYLPFYNEEWWTVQIQRKTHTARTGGNNVINEFELRVGQNIYDGYDGNQVGWLASSSLTMPGGNISQSMNEAWNYVKSVGSSPVATNKMTNYEESQVYIPGNVIVDPFVGSQYVFNHVGKTSNYTFPGYDLGDPMSGSFQEIRYYRRALSSSQFLDLVMNPESIQGHSDSNYGPGSSFDLLSFRTPLGNELEFTEPNGSASYYDNSGTVDNIRQFQFGYNNGNNSAGNSQGSVHPATVDTPNTIASLNGEIYTGSFINFSTFTGISPNDAYNNGYALNFRFDSNPNLYVTSSYIVPNTELNYMDQPSAGIRNRIKNKIQVIDKNEYGTILSPFRSIQQEFEQSGSYTEDLNSLEVGFSFQNEINDDIIATFGHGVVSDVVGDPRLISESGDRYPELTRIAEEYFKKYAGFGQNTPLYRISDDPHIIEKEYDYNRLIKFYETSLFKAIKNYVPARTSLSTGIIVKQHLLERNKADVAVGINIDTVIAKTPESGSTNGLSNAPQSNNSRILTGKSGFNSAIQQENLLITSSIPIGSLTGSAGGSVNKYNVITNEGRFYTSEGDNITLTDGAAAVPLFSDRPNVVSQEENGIFVDVDYEDKVYFEADGAFISQVRWNGLFVGGLSPTPLLPVDIKLEVTSSKRGGIFDTTFFNITSSDPPGLISDNLLEAYPDERLYWNIAGTGVTTEVQGFTFSFGDDIEFLKPEPLSSQQVNWYIDDFTGEWKVDDHQTEFYDGEFSGSEFRTIPAQYNPYRIYADGNDKTPDDTGFIPTPSVDYSQGGGAGGTIQDGSGNFDSITTGTDSITFVASSDLDAGTYYYTGSYLNLIPGRLYNFQADLTISGVFTGNISIVPALTLSDYGAFTPPFAFSNNDVNGVNQSENNTAGSYTFNFNFIPTNIAPGVFPTGYQPFSTGPGSGFDNGGWKFFSAGNTTGTCTFTITNVKISTANTLGPKHFYERDGFTIVPSQSQLFQNSPYNPIINNVSGSRESSFYYDMDFDPVNPGYNFTEGIPSDYTLLVSASQLGWEGANPTADNLLEYAEVPDSNYTTKAIINPRYVGTTLQSADYNFYTGIPSASQLSKRSSTFGIVGVANTPELLAVNRVRYINNETGSWAGDISYGKNAVIDKHPIYLGHFKQSFSEPSIFNTTTFILDQLIQIPFDDITGEQSPLITSSLINGNNENLIQVSSTFEPQREASIIFTNPQKQFSEYNLTLNYATIGVGSYKIFSPTSNYKTLFSNQIDQLSLSDTNTFYRPPFQRWASGGNNTPTFSITKGSFNGVGEDLLSSDLVTNREDLELTSLLSQSAINIFTTGSSNYAESRGLGILTLLGPVKSGLARARVSNDNFVAAGGLNGSVTGPSLAFYNSVNINSRRGDQSYSASSVDNITSFNAVSGVVVPRLISTVGFVPNSAQEVPMRDTGSTFGSFPYVPQTRGLAINTFSSVDGYTVPAQIGDSTVPVIANPESNLQYYRYQMSQSKLDEYEDFDTPFEIKKGDEIRVSYRYPSQVPTSSFADTSNNENYEVINQDFTVIGYEIAPPAVVSEPRNLPVGGSSFTLDIPNLVTSSAPQFKGMALQIDEYYNRMTVAIQNDVCFYLMNYLDGNATVDGCGSGSFVSNVQYHDYVVNNEGENRPTTIRLTVLRSKLREPETKTDPSTPTWVIGTNMSGLDDIYPIKGLTSPRLYGLSGLNYQRKLFWFDGEQVNLALDAGFIWNRLLVSPAPKDLAKPIPSGSINAVTIRRRTDDDSRVMLALPAVSGSKGIQTPSNDGYIIPNDLTPIQQGNVQKIINKLQSENVFQKNTPDDVR